MTVEIFSDTICTLGEGPLWHPQEQRLYWFDILGKRLFRSDGTDEQVWDFDEYVSAAGWIDSGVLLIASETALSVFETDSGESTFLQPLEIDTDRTRSNDGRADPWGGFWIGTMGKNTEHGAGAIYRYIDGRLHRLFDSLTIPNAICFAHDRSCAYFTDTPTRTIMRVMLDADGFPDGAAQVFVDLNPEALNPDGAVVDANGKLWVAQWGASRVACYGLDGGFETAISVPARQASCPAFGGPDLGTLYITSATEGLTSANAGDGKLFSAPSGTTGQSEHRVLL
ncbi:SMP-30/gluconolactonase/LRE family protein [Marivita sp. S0852]|uniref:SMP-30/gluconolactonase/LRE family protein n=1 Tax=Marivita sp. S0852 TaxID=3373893 RepID=UPI0039829B0F